MDDLHWMTATQLLAAYRDQTLSPVDVAEYLLGRIEALDAGVNAMCLIDAETTLAQARASEERWQSGSPMGLLDGVPVAIKDLVLSKGWPTLRGSKTVSRDQAWDQDAPSVARLREHGAVFIGKTTSPEFGWKGTTDNPLTGITRNPWNTKKTPGGSSGGASAALAAGYCPLAIGTDAGGSIRIPASFAGVFGLKPTFGRVAAWPSSPFGSLAHAGPMSRTVEDSAVFLTVMSEPDDRDWFQQPWARQDFSAGLRDGIKGKRIAFSPRLGYVKHVDAEVAATVAEAVARFEKLGAHVVHADPSAGDPSAFFKVLFCSGAGFLLGEMSPEKRALLDPDLNSVVEEASRITLRQYQQALADRAAHGATMKAFMRDYDFLITPATAVAAFDVGRLSPFERDEHHWMPWTPFSYPFNATTQPAASINCGFTQTGLPIGLQIVGRMGDDAGVLRAAYAFEQAAGLADKHPKGF